MKIVTSNHMREMDRQAIEVYHIAGLLLMEHAAQAVFAYMKDVYTVHQPILIVCGPGNNGGDGFALALQLIDAGYDHVSIHCVVALHTMSDDEALFAKMVMKRHIPIHTTQDILEINALLSQQAVLVDALFGTGLSRKIEGFYYTLIHSMNQLQKPIICMDIASGVHSDNGTIMNCAVQGTVTITFECYKKGQLLEPGRSYQGKIIVTSIRMPKQIYQQITHCGEVLDFAMAQGLLAKRSNTAHKGCFGKALMVGGSASMHGAITMAARSALKSGIGMLTLMVPDCIRDIISYKLEESMVYSAPCEHGYFSSAACAMLQEQLSSYDVIVIGNGLGRNDTSAQLVRTVLESDRPCILDGDALYEVGKFPELLLRPYPTILTPHVKEMCYICGCEISDIKKDPIQFSRDFVRRYPNVVLVLKDASTTICDGREVYFHLGGNHALAKGGSGDVLCGIIAGLYGQCRNAMQAAGCGVFVHGYSAQMALQHDDANSLLAGDIIDMLSSVYQSLREA